MRKEATAQVKIIGFVGDMAMGVAYALQDIKWAGEVLIDLKRNRSLNRQRLQRHRWPDLT